MPQAKTSQKLLKAALITTKEKGCPAEWGVSGIHRLPIEAQRASPTR